LATSQCCHTPRRSAIPREFKLRHYPGLRQQWLLESLTIFEVTEKPSLSENPSPESIRLQIADTLEAIANTEGWNNELHLRFLDLLKQIEGDELLWHADEELIHYSGVFNSFNLLGIRVKPDKEEVSDFKHTFREVANDIRNGTTWEEYRRTHGIYERGDFTRWLKGLFSN
jgi:hypothetical protein